MAPSPGVTQLAQLLAYLILLSVSSPVGSVQKGSSLMHMLFYFAKREDTAGTEFFHLIAQIRLYSVFA